MSNRDWLSSSARRWTDRCLLAAWILTLLAWRIEADVRLPRVIGDNMVLQQGLQVRIWGWASPGESVTVTFRNQKQTTTAHEPDGSWAVRLKALKAGGPDRLLVWGKNRIELTNVLVGEVWVCSGQSNMEWPLTRSHEPTSDIANSANPNIRLFTVPKRKSKVPLQDVDSSWQACEPATTPNFSAVAYYFGRALQQARKVPVGLVHTSWGGSPAEVWMSEAALAADPEYQGKILDAYTDAFRRWQQAAKEAQDKGEKAPAVPWYPTELYNGMIAALTNYVIRGAVWYQGESNAGRAHQYRKLFPDLIRNWRRDWALPEMTFLAVQLAPWDRNKKRTLEQIAAEPVESDWAELREAQMLATQTLRKVGVAVITDVGDKDDIHPAKKAPVGERLALAARAIAYEEKVTASGPTYKSARFSKGKAVISFNSVGKGLEARDGELKGFAICGEDGKWVWAKAVIEQDKVVVSSSAVSAPVAVRYGWADFPVVNLWNKDGLPASPFRTDDFTMLTEPK